MHRPSQEKPLPKPRVDNAQNATLTSLLQQLHHSQWWSPAQLHQSQLQELRKLLAYAIVYSPFYRARLRGVDIAKFGWKHFAEIPLLRRRELQTDEQIDCSQLPDSHGIAIEVLTSGSTGTPVKLRSSSAAALIWNAINLREHLWHERDASLPAASIRWRGDGIGLSADGVNMTDWGTPINQYYKTGPGFYLNSGVDVDAQLRWLQKVKPAYLLSHPSNVTALVGLCQQQNVSLEGLLEIRTVGETVSNALRVQAREVLDVPVTDFYSSQELGYIALQCPHSGHYHVQSESVLVEVLREDGSACDPFENGRLVVTSLRNYATPVVRYEIGDYGALGEACPCGRGLPVLQRINGRVRNMLTLPDGARCWPNFGFKQMMQVAPLQQFQIVQHTRECLELKLVVDKELDETQQSSIKKVLCDNLGWSFEIAISYHHTLPRSAGGKFEDFVSLLNLEQQESSHAG